jgi:hypothetical protein
MIDRLAKIIDGKLCLSSAAMGEVFGVTRSALGKWSAAGCPKAKSGWWPLAEVIAWRGLGQAAGTDDKNLSDAALKTKYDAEWKRLQAEKLDFQNAIARGDFVARDEIVSTLARYFTELKRSLMGLSRMLGSQVAPYLDGASARRIESELTKIINEALARMADGDIYVPSKRRKKKA